MFPRDFYTPHGYLDNPAYAWKLGKGGILRSTSGVGMEWHYPALPESYNQRRDYRAGLQLAFQYRNFLFSTHDFQQAKIRLYSDYHSKNLMTFCFQLNENLFVETSYFLLDQENGDNLACRVMVANGGEQPEMLRFGAILAYECQPENIRTWLSGLYSKANNKGLTIGEWQEGIKLHLATSEDAAFAAEFDSPESLKDVLQSRPRLATKNPEANKWRRDLALIYDLTIQPKSYEEVDFVLTRAQTERIATETAHSYLVENKVSEILAERVEADNEFWKNAPKLRGDWPDYIRRGLVYDFETLRMMVRRPLGIYRHAWDAMQLQAPRVVLGEAAVDMAILAYADPQAAKEVLLGTFADAPEPNVPCSREDGSYNMVANDGSPCGTAPEWCFPFHCVNLVYQQTGDQKWLAEIYPHLEDFVGWWITNRSNASGLPFYKCSWEAGQDNSPRFGIKDDPSGGGALTEHLWPVDLQAAMAQCCKLLAEWAREIGQDGQQWQQLADKYGEMTRKMWLPDKAWFHDYDTRAGHFTDVLDTMQLAPLLCGVTTPEQRELLAPKVADPPKHGQIFHPLMWPSIAFCLIESASEGDFHDLAAKHSWQGIQAVYRWLDSNPLSTEPAQGGLPGVGREYWPQVVAPHAQPPRAGGGAEVYGWGCLNALLLLRHIVGLREEVLAGTNSAFDSNVRTTFENAENGNVTATANVNNSDTEIKESFAFSLTPGLPNELLQVGKSYHVGPLHYRTANFRIRYTVLNDNLLEIRLIIHTDKPLKLNVSTEGNLGVQHISAKNNLYRLKFQLANHQKLTLAFGV